MSDALTSLLGRLSVEQLTVDTFQGDSHDLGWGTVFGGQVLGQGVMAASNTVPDDRFVHSLHAYFLRPGKVDRPVSYEIDRIRDGRSFTTRRVVGLQDDRPIFNLAASFQVVEEGLEHQDEMPNAPKPSDVLSEAELGRLIESQLPDSVRNMLSQERPILIKPVDPVNPLHPEVKPGRKMVWFRTDGVMPDEYRLHQATLAYASDFQFLTTAIQPHGVSLLSNGVRMASLDHAMWFHRPFRMDSWLLHVIDSPSASGGRGLVRGRFFAEDGTLVASTAQEGMVRMKARPSMS